MTDKGFNFFDECTARCVHDLQNIRKATVELTFSTQKANACSPWTACRFCIRLLPAMTYYA